MKSECYHTSYHDIYIKIASCSAAGGTRVQGVHILVIAVNCHGYDCFKSLCKMLLVAHPLHTKGTSGDWSLMLIVNISFCAVRHSLSVYESREGATVAWMGLDSYPLSVYPNPTLRDQNFIAKHRQLCSTCRDVVYIFTPILA